MRLFKLCTGEYIVSVGRGTGGTEIAESEYNTILATIRSKPTAPSGYDYRLKEDLTWELYELPEPPEDPEIEDSEALNIITGGSV